MTQFTGSEVDREVRDSHGVRRGFHRARRVRCAHGGRVRRAERAAAKIGRAGRGCESYNYRPDFARIYEVDVVVMHYPPSG